MILTQGQEDAMVMVSNLLQVEGAAFGVLTGYAGTGKSTLLKVIAEEFGNPIVVCPTGKAAIRVREAAGLQAMTVHRWIYNPTENSNTGETFWRKKEVDLVQVPCNRLIVVDEASMVGEDMWEDIWTTAISLRIKVLLIGDPFQLGPVTRQRDGVWKSFSTLTDLPTTYRADLTEVVRQALDSPIIRASMMIRESEMGAMDAVSDIITTVAPEKMVSTFLAMDANRALIAHRNITRQQLNLEVRTALNYNYNEIEEGEPLLVLFNNYTIDRFNGEVLTFSKWEVKPAAPEAIRDRYKNTSSMMSYGIASIAEASALVTLSTEEVFAQTQGMSETVVSRAGKGYASKNFGYERRNAPSHLNANFGYCLTTHKSQGSEYNDVVVVIEPSIGAYSGGLYGYNGRRHLYTAITRAKANVSLCFI